MVVECWYGFLTIWCCFCGFLSRRALLTREKRIHAVRVAAVAEDRRCFVLEVETDGGTYVKELVHGDFGRSEPSVAGRLGRDCELLALDVLSVM